MFSRTATLFTQHLHRYSVAFLTSGEEKRVMKLWKYEREYLSLSDKLAEESLSVSEYLAVNARLTKIIQQNRKGFYATLDLRYVPLAERGIGK
jgi:hypothetical protein